jgi:inosine-uridine nucleoside N-ribohydrolase
MSTKHLVWLDCDPGHDDAMAIILATHNPSVNLLGISTICGNQTVQKTTTNALKVLALVGKKVDVVQGSEEGICCPSRACGEIHGGTGLDGSEIPEPICKPIDKNAIIAMYEAITSQKEKVIVVGTAQLTNIALLLKVFPQVKQSIKEIVIMGGNIGIGNMHPSSEWNIAGDPEAAEIVFNCGLKVVMIPLEVTHKVLVTSKILDAITEACKHSKFAKIIRELMLFFAIGYDKTFKMPDPPLHDPCTIAYIIDPSLFKCELVYVGVERMSSMCNGRTVCDMFHMTKNKPNVHLATAVSVDGFWDLMIKALVSANELAKK